MKVTNGELLQEYERLRPQHDSNAATRRALALRYGLSEEGVRWRLRRAIKRQQATPPNVIRLQPDMDDLPLDAVPDGYFVKRMSTAVDKDGNIQEQWLRSDVESKRTAEIQDAIPVGHHLKGVSTYVDEQGNVRGQWIKTDRAAQQWQDTINAVLERIPQIIHPLPPIAATPAPANDLLALYPLADLHIGLYAAAQDGERDWRLADAVALIKGCIDDLIARTPPAAEAVVANIGDLMHVDNLVNRTPNSGAPLDADGRMIEVIQAATEVMVYAIDRAAQRHKRVNVVLQSGNHDEVSALVLQTAIALLYRNNPYIHVHQSGKRTHVMQHGQVALGFTHGDTIKANALPLIMAVDYPEIWAATRYRVWHTGHIHHLTTQEYPGCIVRSHQSPAPRDAWHERSGYRSGHSMSSVVYDGIGEYTENTIQIRHQAGAQGVARPAVAEVNRAA